MFKSSILRAFPRLGIGTAVMIVSLSCRYPSEGNPVKSNTEADAEVTTTEPAWKPLDQERARKVVDEWKSRKKRGNDPGVEAGKFNRNQNKDYLAAAEAFHLVGDTPAAIAMLDTLLAGVASDAAVNREGARDSKNIQLRDAALAWALRYHFDGQAPDAERARNLLLQFAENMPEWPIRVDRKRNDWRPQNNDAIYSNYGSGGLWGGWYHLDLREAFPLLRAYDLTRSTISDEEQRLMVDGIFDHQVKVLSRWDPLYHNTDIYEIEGLVRFGLVLKRPDYIHTAVDRMRKLYYRGFSPDGFWHEVTPAYHRQVASPLVSLASLLKGYSDPSGWHHPESGLRFDQLRMDEEFEAHIRRIKHSQEKITLPDGYLLALNDADPGRYQGTEKVESRPELLGTSGVALLGSGDGSEQERVVLNFEGTYGHEHLDANSLYWYALGVSAFDETRYRPVEGSNSTRAWSQSTYAHNTVVIDERDQPARFSKPYRAFGKDDQMQGSITWPLRDSSGGSNHAGDLLLFDGSEGSVQAVEVEGKKAYRPAAEVYRRSIIKVNLGHGASYLVDIFRVKGGKIHDYMLHGALSHPYTAEYSLKLDAVEAPKPNPVAGTGKDSAKSFLQLLASQRATQPWQVTYSIMNGPQTRTWMLSPNGALIHSYTAPAINRVGNAVFTGVRNENEESVFVAIHEVYRDKPQIKGARLLVEPSNAHAGLAIEIDLGTRKEVVLSTFDQSKDVHAVTTDGTKITLQGRLAWLEIGDRAPRRAILWDGTSLDFAERKLLQSPRAAIEGSVIKTLRRENGARHDALVVDGELPLSDALKNSVVHVQFGNELTWSYRIEGVERDGENWMIRIEHEPGFEIQPDGLAKMLFHPGWGHRGDVHFRIPLVSKTEAN